MGQPEPGASSEQIIEFETRYDVVLPESIRNFHGAVNGCEIIGDHLFELWPLGKVSRVPEEVATWRGIPDYGDIVETLPNVHNYFAFADAFICLTVFAVEICNGQIETPVVLISGSSWVKVADTFDEFWLKIIEDPELVMSI